MNSPALTGVPPVSEQEMSADVATTEIEYDRIAEIDSRLRLLSAAVELQIQLDSCSDMAEAARTVAIRVKESLACGSVMVAWQLNHECKIVADSRFDAGELPGEYRLAEAAAAEVMTRSTLTVWPTNEAGNRHALMAVAQFANADSIRRICAVPFIDSAGHARGALIVLDGRQRPSDEGEPEWMDSALLHVIATPLASKLASVQRAEPSRVERWVANVEATFKRCGRREVLWAAGVFALLMLLPVRYKVRGDCELVPVQRRFVAAPFDGPLESVLVRPGDTVRTGDLLATINPREIEYELAALQASLSSAVQEKKGTIFEQDFAASKIATLETRRLEIETGLLQYQRDNLEIRSPIDGVVVSGDLRHAEGTPVSTGETLFEVAPLGTMVVEVAVPEHEWSSVRPEMAVRFELFALPGQTYRGRLEQIHPRAELRDQENVFIGEVVYDDDDGVLRPGMRGRCWIAGDRHPLAWNLFHRAYDMSRLALRSTLGW